MPHTPTDNLVTLDEQLLIGMGNQLYLHYTIPNCKYGNATPGNVSRYTFRAGTYYAQKSVSQTWPHTSTKDTFKLYTCIYIQAVWVRLCQFSFVRISNIFCHVYSLPLHYPTMWLRSVYPTPRPRLSATRSLRNLRIRRSELANHTVCVCVCVHAWRRVN